MKKVLVVIDMQNDFISGALGNDACKAVVPNVVEKIRKVVENGCDIVFTMDTHYESYLETQEGQKLPVKHCVEGSEGWYLDSNIEDVLCQTVSEGTLTKEELYSSENCFIKNTFGSTDLGDFISCNRYESVELIGVCTDICVISNAMVIKAFNPEVEITVDSSCCAGVTVESHERALEAMKSCQINVV